MILSILKVVFKILPAVLEQVRRWDAEKNAKLIVEAQERAIVLERLKLADAKLKERHEVLDAETDALKKKLADLLAAEPAAGDK